MSAFSATGMMVVMIVVAVEAVVVTVEVCGDGAPMRS